MDAAIQTIKISFSYVYKDTTNFNFLLSTHSGITPEYQRQIFKISNKIQVMCYNH